jgi:hypothetical protein
MDLEQEEAQAVQRAGLLTRRGPYKQFQAACERDMIDGTPVLIMETIGATWETYTELVHADLLAEWGAS